ncbi:SDR family NAD(P)-dependent oxidoreductase [Nonomuraea basaltis]|uniref:SDR family NAD(P)-dependent oxidoreductase n=1 Tax=Nonomuraea basaltis TaxID=2495887 RepID=UPI00110C6ED4|nr:SDR family oxidoreductase [Nonomuraea basaltis]TMR89912.1 SDR family oxidoreductase [Nonomuraea basaltis]
MSSVAEAGRARRLEHKTAVIFGAGGEVGGAVAREFAAQGARVFLSGRTRASVQPLAKELSGVSAEVDALDEAAVNGYVDEVARAADGIDIVFNAMGPQAAEYRNGTGTIKLPIETFMLPIMTIVRSQFITARAAARHFTAQGDGVIVFLSATPSQGLQNTAAIGAAYGAIESLTRSLAADLSPSGVRVVCVRSMLMSGSRIQRQTIAMAAEAAGLPEAKMAEIISSRVLLRRSATAADAARVVSFVASAEAGMLTGAIVNASGGAVLD